MAPYTRPQQRVWLGLHPPVRVARRDADGDEGAGAEGVIDYCNGLEGEGEGLVGGESAV